MNLMLNNLSLILPMIVNMGKMTPPINTDILEPITKPEVTNLFAGNASLYIFFVVFIVIIASSNAILFYLIKTLSRNIKATIDFSTNVTGLITEIKSYESHVDSRLDMVNQKIDNIDNSTKDIRDEIRDILSDIQNITNQSVLNMTDKINAFDKEISKLRTWCRSVNIIKNSDHDNNDRGDKM